jgi:CRP/FNR family transcriptional regulator, cyclic AMP receptor protein
VLRRNIESAIARVSPMREILEYCRDVPLWDVTNGTELLTEGQSTGHVYILAQGRIEVLRGGTQVIVVDEPGSLLGEMSLLLGVPHTASARALGDAKVHVIEDGVAFFKANPGLSWLVARLLANRLNAATTYLADLKAQYADHGTHLEMVGEVLESLMHHQERDFHPGSERDPGR